MNVILLSFFGAVLAVAADVLIKRGHPWVGAVLYASCAWPAYWCFRRNEFGYVTVIWAAVLVIVGVLVGRWIFNEPITPFRIVGMIAALLAIGLTK